MSVQKSDLEKRYEEHLRRLIESLSREIVEAKTKLYQTEYLLATFQAIKEDIDKESPNK